MWDMNSSYIKTILIRIKIKLTETHDNKDKKIQKNIIERYKNVRKLLKFIREHSRIILSR